MAIVDILELAGAGAADPNLDFSAVLDGVLDDHNVAYVPARRIGGVPMPYQLPHTIDLAGRGAQIICEDGAVLRGVAGQPVFESHAANRRMRISGGRWERGSALLHHTSASTFQLLRVHGATVVEFDAAFQFTGAAIACAWRDCRFEGCLAGLHFGGVANVHTVDRCHFAGCNDAILLDTAQDNRLQFEVARCVFAGNNRGVSVYGAAQQGLSVRQCRFEGQHDVDIRLHLEGAAGWVDSTTIEHCVFGPPGPNQTERVRSHQQVSFRASQNLADVDPPTLVFADVTVSAAKYKTWLDRNRLRHASGGTYTQALLRKVGAGCLQIIEPTTNC